MQVNIRGGTHEESAFLPGSVAPVFGLATLRGQDMVAWYTTAWFDKHVKCPGAANAATCEAQADARLLTDRWRNDAPGQAVDLNGDANLFSFYLRSRYDFLSAGGDEVECADMRAGCPTMAPDGLPLPYSLLADAHQPDEGTGESEPCALSQTGTEGADDEKTLPPTDAGDAIRGKGGDDRLRGGAGDDCLYGNKGDDNLRGDEGKDELRGGSGSDRIAAAEGEADVIACGRGADDHAIVDELDATTNSCERVTFS
jgi:hypothetical protein